MMKFVADEDFDNHILRGLLRRQPNLDIIRVQDTDLAGAKDSNVLNWASQEQRILLTHDVNTMTKHAYELIHMKESVPGVIAVPQTLSIGKAIEDILTIAECGSPDELRNQIFYLPL
jgi:hypothetical protein